MASTPKVKAFLLCDQVIIGQDSKHSVIGVFQSIHAPSFPVFHPRFGIYVRLGEMHGNYDLAIQFVDPDGERTLGEAQLKGIKHDRPLDDFESGVNLPGIEIPNAGIFEVRLVANGDLINVDTLRAVQVSMPKSSADGEVADDDEGEADKGPGSLPEDPFA